MNKFVVYKHTFPNQKIYIGITCVGVKKRWLNGKGYRKSYVGKAINKYGWENIKHEIIFDGLTQEQAEQKEIELIAQFKSNKREYGYNVSNGGNHRGKVSEETKIKIGKANTGHIHSKKTRDIISKKSKAMWSNEDFRKKHLGKVIGAKGKVPWNKGIPQSEDAKKKNRQAHLGRSAWNKGKPTELKTKEKISQANKGKPAWNKGKHGYFVFTEEMRKKFIENNGKSKGVLCVETNKTYLSGRQCAIDMNIDRSGVTRACNSKSHYYKGFHFIYLDINQSVRDNNLAEYNIAKAILN